MHIGDLLDAIEIGQALPKHLEKELHDALAKMRYGKHLLGSIESPGALGFELLQSNDFFKIGSGLTDNHRVVFTLDAIRDKHGSLGCVALADHLRWMVDSQANSETISLILRPLNNALEGCGSVVLDLEELAGDLEQALQSDVHKPLTTALLTGRLSKIKGLNARQASSEQDFQYRLIGRMLIMWALFDLQIIASKLFHAEWNSRETGGIDNPDMVTVDTVRKVMKRFYDVAEEVCRAFKTGRFDPKMDRRARAFLRTYNLRGHALRNGLSFGLTREQLISGKVSASERRRVSRYLEEVRKVAHEMYALFDGDKPKVASSKHIKFIKLHGQVVKSKFGQPAFDTPKQIKEALKRSSRASTHRFSMSALVALIYAIRKVVETLGSMPADQRAVIEFDAQPTEAPGRWSKDVQETLVKELLLPYRHLFTRDHKSSGQDDELDRLPRVKTNALVDPRKATDLGKLAAHMGVGLSPAGIIDVAKQRDRPYRAFREAAEVSEDLLLPENERLSLYISRHLESSLQWRFASEKHDTIY